MAKLTAHLRFNDGKCREAFAYYQKALGGGETTFMTVAESPMAKEMPAEGQHLIMHASFRMGDIAFSGSDMMRDKAVIGDNVTVMLDCDNEDQVNSVFNVLKEGGDVFMAPEPQFWGGVFGMVTDKYGVEWSLHYQKIPMSEALKQAKEN